MKKLMILSMRRSGRNWLEKSLKSNFDISSNTIVKYHAPQWFWNHPGNRFIFDLYNDKNVVSVVLHRDGRDVLVSNYHYCIDSGEARDLGTHLYVEKMNFNEWLKSFIFIADGKMPGETPLQYWIGYTLNMYMLDCYQITYEDLLRGYEGDHPVLAEIGRLCEWKRKVDKLEPERIIHANRGGNWKSNVGRWKNYFNEESLKKFNEDADYVMESIYGKDWEDG